MKASHPLFREGTEWRKLTKKERGNKPWKYLALLDVFFPCHTGVTKRYECRGSDGDLYMVIVPEGILMCAGYAWNGNTASPDRIGFAWLIRASLPHDGIFQFSGALSFPRDQVTLSFANRLYFQLSPAWIGWAYYAGLTVGSWYVWCQPPKDGEYIDVCELAQPAAA